MHVVIIGAVALGPKAACRLKRLAPDARVTMIDQGARVSYGGCGIPYYVSGDISDVKELQSTSFHMVRDPKFFHGAKGVEVLTRKRADRIDRQSRIVHATDLESGDAVQFSYDKLVLAMGSRPRKLDLPGINLNGVFAVSNLEEAEGIRARVEAGKVSKAVVVGAGFIGLEIAEALTDMWGVQTTVVEIADQVLPGFVSADLARMAQKHMQEHDVAFRLSANVLGFAGDGRVERVLLEGEELEADLVIMSAGVVPNSELAAQAGLDVSSKGAIIVNSRMQTSDPDIYAGGNCVQVTNLVTGQPGYYPLGSLANRQGRVIGTNLAGGEAEFSGAVGSFAVKLFEISVAGTGLSPDAAKRSGFDAIHSHVVQADRAHFFPENELMHLEMVVERTGRVLGAQGLCAKGDGLVGRIGAVAAVLGDHPHVSVISNLEYPYSPPFSSAMDIVNAAANAAENILEGRTSPLSIAEFSALWDNPQRDFQVLDCRGQANAQPFLEKYPDVWMNIPQDELRERLGEVPRDKNLILVCNAGGRSYESQVTLEEAGVSGSRNLQGGVAAIRRSGMDI
ncbi:Pyridine nucleotide-disulphide oxidoreductase [Desulfonatronum thiosulfatophilum]|uniref:Pyridine nucleotide-disulphide oxidoreductase n=1 Tax=Desulfonatronum thiosulfatophilum TaxID=617002 RepID=A0A1G6DC17_9BACT|nr:FAD-dependent oxidoreductase [Desulfonatronum thiosulfatophilum]SDB42694.1 Pyridine nucleotide-disulphide oxidoreductase [Desulfonatronum thiosulfatophilum]